jgi:hypothetical protein
MQQQQVHTVPSCAEKIDIVPCAPTFRRRFESVEARAFSQGKGDDIPQIMSQRVVVPDQRPAAEHD